jgi:hypothetical protein
MTSSGILIALAVCIVLALVVFVPVVLRARKVDLEKGGGTKSAPPPEETLAALKEDGEEFGLFDQDDGEKIAAPFAEQIEDILAARIKADPGLASVKLDFGTAPDGSLQIWVDEVCYTDVKKIPDEKLRQAVAEAIQAWEKHYAKA